MLSQSKHGAGFLEGLPGASAALSGLGLGRSNCPRALPWAFGFLPLRGACAT